MTLLLACSDSPYEPTPEHLIGEFSGRAGQNFQIYDLFLAVDEVADSVRGLWSLAFLTTCSTHDGPFSGTLDGDQLRLRLRPDEGYEATLDLTVRVLPGDSVLSGGLTVVAVGSEPLCFTDFASIRLHQGEVTGLRSDVRGVVQPNKRMQLAGASTHRNRRIVRRPEGHRS